MNKWQSIGNSAHFSSKLYLSLECADDWGGFNENVGKQCKKSQLNDQKKRPSNDTGSCSSPWAAFCCLPSKPIRLRTINKYCLRPFLFAHINIHMLVRLLADEKYENVCKSNYLWRNVRGACTRNAVKWIPQSKIWIDRSETHFFGSRKRCTSTDSLDGHNPIERVHSHLEGTFCWLNCHSIWNVCKFDYKNPERVTSICQVHSLWNGEKVATSSPNLLMALTKRQSTGYAKDSSLEIIFCDDTM